jgi:hypothetical protein
MKKNLIDFVGTFAEAKGGPWRDSLLKVSELRRGADGPMDAFYDKAFERCRTRPQLPAAPAAAPARTPSENRGLADEFLAALIRRLGRIDGAGDAKVRAEARGLIKDEPKYGTVPEVSKLVATLDAVQAEALLKSLAEKRILFGQAVNVGGDLIDALRPRRDLDWDGLERIILPAAPKPVTWCSLIYSYWLDEGGIPWALERLADRIENGVVRTTQPLQAVRIDDASTVAVVVSKYASIWQQGDLPHVDERRRQYQALYGFPLYSAARWGALETVDPRHTFPPAFHRFLAEAMHYYRDMRNLQMLPDIQPVRAAFDTLVDAIREGNENMRRARPPEVLAQMEFTKQVLGGYRNNNAPAPGFVDLDVLKDEWKARLPGRPGLQAALHPWQNAANTVAMLYRWQRPNIAEYTKLAEYGELILVLARILGDELNLSESIFAAFIELIQDAVQNYVTSYKAVAQVDLSARGAFMGAPTEAMARYIQPPIIPPLKRSWAAEVPVIA